MPVRLRSILFLLALAMGGGSACAPAIPDASVSATPSPPDSVSRASEAPAVASRPRGAVSIVEVYGPRRLPVGEASDYRLRLAPGFEWPIQYAWDFGDGTAAVGNNVLHAFSSPGTYTVEVIARNRVSADTARFPVTVEPSREPVPARPDAPEPFAARAPFEAGDVVWITNTYKRREDAESEAALFSQADFRAAVVPSNRGGTTVYFVAVGGYDDEAEAIAARARVLRVRTTPLWLLRLGPSYAGN